MRPRRGAVAAGALAVVLLGGADGGCRSDREVPVTVVRAGVQCGGEGEELSARRIGSAQELAGLLSGWPATELGVSPTRAPDFAKEAVLLVSAGQRPTAGWALELASPTAAVKDRVALVQVSLVAPATGAMTAQMVTSPCLVVKLPKEKLDEVKVAHVEKTTIVGTVSLR